MELSPDVLTWVTANVSAAGYILITMVAVKGVAVALTALQICSVAETFDEDSENLLKTSDTGYGMAKVKKGEGLLAGEWWSWWHWPPAAAAGRFLPCCSGGARARHALPYIQ